MSKMDSTEEEIGDGDTRNGDPLSNSAYEKIMTAVGTEGRYQKLLIYAFILPLSFYTPFGASSILLILSTPSHSCHVPRSPGKHSFSTEQWLNLTVPWEEGGDGLFHPSQCFMYNITYWDNHYNADISTVINCKFGWDYDRSNWRETAVSDFDWVCDNANIVTTIFSLAVAGNAVGTLIFSILADRLGRRPVFFLMVLINCIFGLVNMIVPSWQLFALTRFLTCLAFFSIYQMPYIIVVELSSEHLRGVTAALSFIVGTLGMCCVSLFAWLLAHWQIFGILCHAPSVLFLLYWRFLPESPRWLLSMDRVDECERIMIQVATTNGLKPPPNLRHLLNKAQAEEKNSATVKDLFKYRTLRKHLVIASLNTTIFCVVYSGIVLNIHNMTGNEFVNFFVLSLVEIPGNVVGVVSAHYLGRRLTTIYALALSALFSGLASVTVSDQWLLITFCGLVKLFVTEAVLVVYMQIGELFPTPLRSLSYGITGVTGLSATVLVPSLMALGTSDQKLPYYILSGLSVFGAAVSIFLPETLGLPLPQTVEQANQVGYGQSYCFCLTQWTKQRNIAHNHSNVPNRKASTSDTLAVNDENTSVILLA